MADWLTASGEGYKENEHENEFFCDSINHKVKNQC